MCGAESILQTVRERIKVAVSEKVQLRFDQLISKITEISDVSLKGKDQFFAKLSVDGHPPLDSFNVKFECKNRLFSRDYHTIFSVEGACSSLNDWNCSLQYNKKNAVFVSKNQVAAAFFNGIPTLTSRCRELDIVKLEIYQNKDNSSIVLETMAGSVTWMLIPPLTYQVPFETKDFLGILQILQLCCMIKYAEGV